MTETEKPGQNQEGPEGEGRASTAEQKLKSKTKQQTEHLAPPIFSLFLPVLACHFPRYSRIFLFF